MWLQSPYCNLTTFQFLKVEVKLRSNMFKSGRLHFYLLTPSLTYILSHSLTEATQNLPKARFFYLVPTHESLHHVLSNPVDALIWCDEGGKKIWPEYLLS